MHNDIIQTIDNGQLMVMLILDLSSAFDTVDLDIMLSILHRRLSVDGVALNWLYSYLTDHCQAFSVVSLLHCSTRINSWACGILGQHWGRRRSVRSVRGQPPSVRWWSTYLPAHRTWLGIHRFHASGWPLTFLAAVHSDDYNLTPRKVSWSGWDREQCFVVWLVITAPFPTVP